MSQQHRSLYLLEDATQRRVGEWLRLCCARGAPVLVYETLRDEDRQAELYAKGRTTAGKIVTNARPGWSWHQYGMAVDAVPYEYFFRDDNNLLLKAGGADQNTLIDKKLDWDPFLSAAHKSSFSGDRDVRHLDHRWATMVTCAASVGLEWAGNWQGFTEYVHFQYSNGKTIEQVRKERGVERERDQV